MRIADDSTLGNIKTGMSDLPSYSYVTAYS